MNFNEDHRVNHEKFSFDDILLVPSYAKLGDGEDDGILDCELFGHKLTFPVISSPMDTVTEIEMMDAFLENGGVGIHHRYNLEKMVSAMKKVKWGGFAISPSMGIDAVAKMANENPCVFWVGDVAHGDSEKFIDFCKDLISNGVKNIVSGNICTPLAGERFMKIGINHLRAGIGSGSKCTTRSQTGFGYPQGSCVYEMRRELGQDVIIFSDGGCNSFGDILKAVSLGTDFIISGHLFAGTDECPKILGENGKPIYRGMASREALESRKKDFFIEGEGFEIEPKGSVVNVIRDIKTAIKAGCYYGGVSHFKDLCEVEKILITQNSYVEGLVRK